MTPIPTRDRVVAALRAAWSADTAEIPGEWTADNPAKGHCDVSSLVLLEYLGGDLELHRVTRDGVFQEHHYSNLLPGDDAFDLTREQFRDGEQLERLERLTNASIRERYPTARSSLRDRHRRLSERVVSQLGSPLEPLGGPQRSAQ